MRTEAAATLRHLEDFAAVESLLAMLADPDKEEWHWICIEALGELHAAVKEPQ